MTYLSPNKNNYLLSLKDSISPILIIGFIVLTILGILAGVNALNFIFPMLAFILSVFLYNNNPVAYMGFSWWIWFLSPLIRRLIDFRAGFSDQSLILITPPLVLLATIPSFVKYILTKYPYNHIFLPYILAFIGIFYSFLVGLTIPLSEGSNIFLINRSSVIAQFVQWIAPISFSYFIVSNWQIYPRLKNNTKTTFFWGGLIIGFYGLIQSFMMPAWDQAWQEQVIKVGFANVQNSIWGSLNSPGHFATILIPFLLLCLSSQSSLKIPMTIIFILDILLTRVRTAFIAGFIGLVLFSGSLKPRLQMRFIFVFCIMVICLFSLTSMGFFPTLFDRVYTLSNIQIDGSFQARQHVYSSLTEQALINPIGHGMGSLNLADSGILLIFYEMGWLGVLPFFSGLALLFSNIQINSKMKVDIPFMKACFAISFAILSMIPNGNIFGGGGLGGLLIWTFPSIMMSGVLFYKNYHFVNL